MAVGEPVWPEMYTVKGVSLGTTYAGIKKKVSDDLLVVKICSDAKVSGVFTQNAFCAAPIHLCRRHLAEESSRVFVINSGNANACTGEVGMQAALRTCEIAAELASTDGEVITPSQVLPFSTGVIGEPLPIDKIVAALPNALANSGENNWLSASRAIMTTDTRPKGASSRIEYQGDSICVSGISKGAGMIKPNMATMLGFIATDANVSREVLDGISKYCANKSFNRITIDGDTSTNDSCMLIATGKSAAPLIDRASGELYELLLDAICSVYQSLALQIVQDGEGATKCVEVNVSGGMTQQESLDVAYAIAHSPLVKTAMFASDPNWGRIIAAIGYAGVDGLDSRKVSVYLDDVSIVESGGRAPSYDEELGQAVVSKESYSIRVQLGRGECQESIWTSDLSHEYVRINAEYRS